VGGGEECEFVGSIAFGFRLRVERVTCDDDGGAIRC